MELHTQTDRFSKAKTAVEINIAARWRKHKWKYQYRKLNQELRHNRLQKNSTQAVGEDSGFWSRLKAIPRGPENLHLVSCSQSCHFWLKTGPKISTLAGKREMFSFYLKDV